MKRASPPLSRKWTIVGRILDKFSKPIALQLARTNITPNQVTILRFLFFIPLSTFFFSRGSWGKVIIGAVLANLFNFFDYVDGDLARFKNMYSDFGDRLEHVLDKVGLFLIFFGGRTPDIFLFVPHFILSTIISSIINFLDMLLLYSSM